VEHVFLLIQEIWGYFGGNPKFVIIIEFPGRVVGRKPIMKKMDLKADRPDFYTGSFL
jgi:hypothetical protein